MSRICTKCKESIPDTEQLGPVNEKYPVCTKCWAEWKEYQIMVMNEMKLDIAVVCCARTFAQTALLGEHVGMSWCA